MDQVTVAITGASGAQYGLRLIECLVAADKRVNILVSKAAQVVIATETDIKLPTRSHWVEFFSQKHQAKEGQIRVYGVEEWLAPVASGSGGSQAMVICPCSTGTLSAVATGASNNLIERAADVALKERKPLIMVPRETPYSEIHLQNMLTLTRMGAVILPASPGFYNKPSDINDLVDFIVARILGHLGIEQDMVPKWGE
ncbi:MAG: aromatic acid decarboxylase [Gammaproteobacteria bacterium]|nr:MAG: aromatic acid decarboxylase [Gammaproteobacteria bacterium]